MKVENIWHQQHLRKTYNTKCKAVEESCKGLHPRPGNRIYRANPKALLASCMSHNKAIARNELSISITSIKDMWVSSSRYYLTCFSPYHFQCLGLYVQVYLSRMIDSQCPSFKVKRHMNNTELYIHISNCNRTAVHQTNTIHQFDTIEISGILRPGVK